MRNILSGCFIAFSMYSRIPVPMVEWTKPRMRYVLCWFPAVGAVCGVIFWLWFFGAEYLGINPAAAGILGSCIPIFVTGGIHLDGFLDTLDARSSFGTKEQKLNILTDPHIGAFAAIGLGVYLLSYAGCLVQLYLAVLETQKWQRMAVFCLIFPLERALSGLSVVCFPCARDSGLAKTFSDAAHKKRTAGILLTLTGGIVLILLTLGIWETAVVGGLGILIFFRYRQMAQREFGGITGDLAGWFLQVFELTELAALTVLSLWMD